MLYAYCYVRKEHLRLENPCRTFRNNKTSPRRYSQNFHLSDHTVLRQADTDEPKNRYLNFFINYEDLGMNLFARGVFYDHINGWVLLSYFSILRFKTR